MVMVRVFWSLLEAVGRLAGGLREVAESLREGPCQTPRLDVYLAITYRRCVSGRAQHLHTRSAKRVGQVISTIHPVQSGLRFQVWAD
jgi:hypothetical protein